MRFSMKKISMPAFIGCILAIICGYFLSMTTSIRVQAQQVRTRYVNPAGEDFPIWGWYCFFSDVLPADSSFQQLKDAGFNMGMQTIHTDTTLMKEVLRKAKKYDFKMIIQSGMVGNMTRLPGTVRMLKDYPALLGYFVMDEPKMDQFPLCRQYKDIIEHNDPKAWPYVNLLACWDNAGKAWGSDDFATYVEDFIKVFQPSVLSVDHYPVITTDGVHISSRFYNTYEVLAQVYKDHGIPFWAFMDCTALAPMQWPDETNMRFAVFAALAYGCQGIEWWTYTLPESNKEDWKEAPVMPGGERTPIWYAMRNVNMEVKALKDVFLGCSVVDVAHTGAKLPLGTKRLSSLPAPFRRLDSGDAGVLVSHISNKDKEYLVILNHDVEKSQRIRLTRSDNTRPIYQLMPTGEERRAADLSYTLSPGNYIILRFR